MSCNNSLAEEMIAGEKRWLEYQITPCGTTPQYFTIISATYELKKLFGAYETQTGSCLVDNDEKTVRCLIEATEKGSYLMILTWSIADEIFKEKVRIDVC